MEQFTREERERINDLVADALDLPAAEREPFVRAQCAAERICDEVLRLLRQVQESTEPMPRAEDRGPLAGETIGRFRLLKLLGRGAFGEVYLAIRLDIGQRAAVKILRMTIVDAPTEKRFEQEARLLAGLDHRNIVKLLDYGHAPDGRPYLAMEYVGGGNLATWCKQQRLTIRERILLFRKVCDAVQYAHEQLLVHRDLKPENILIDQQGEPKLVDFGLVRVLGLSDALTTNSVVDVEMQQSVGGTYEYASPEQLVGGPISTATDVYGLGAVLFELLAGRVPLKKGEAGPETESNFIRRVLNQEPPSLSKLPLPEKVSSERKATARELRRFLNADLDAILNQALAKAAADRYGNARELREDLAHYLNSEPVGARRGSIGNRLMLFARKHRYSVPAAAALVVLAAVTGVDMWTQNRQLRSADAARTRTFSRIMLAAASFEKGMDGLERSCHPDQVRAQMAAANERMNADPTPDTRFHAARCRRIFAEFLLQSTDVSQHKQGNDLLQGAKSLLTALRSDDPDYGGLDDELKAISTIETELRLGKWTNSGLGFASEPIPPALPAGSDMLDRARVERNLGDLWRSLGEPDRAAAAYLRAVANYDASGFSQENAPLVAERADCEKRLHEVRSAEKTRPKGQTQ